MNVRSATSGVPATRPPKAVIGGWLSDEEGESFATYAAEIGIDTSALATLLIAREMSENGLGATRANGRSPPLLKGRRISARTARRDLRDRFRAHAAGFGMSSDSAAAAVFRAELEERWLGKVIGLHRESS